LVLDALFHLKIIYSKEREKKVSMVIKKVAAVIITFADFFPWFPHPIRMVGKCTCWMKRQKAGHYRID
jgi:hypothetical protein